MYQLLLLLVFLSAIHVQARIPFGMLMNGNADTKIEKRVFNFTFLAIDYLRPTPVQDVVRDPFDTSRKVCTLAHTKPGVAVIIGPSDPSSAHYVRSFCSTFNIPHLEIHPDLEVLSGESGEDAGKMTLNLWPDLRMLKQAYSDLADKFQWNQIMILTSTTQSTGYLPILTHILERENSPDNKVLIRPVKDIDGAIKEIKDFPLYKNVIVDLIEEQCLEFMKKAKGAQLLSGYYHYHFTTMELYPLANQIGPYTTGSVNVTTFSMIDVESKAYSDMKRKWELSDQGPDFKQVMGKTKNALIYDSVLYAAYAMNNLLSSTPSFKTEAMKCNGLGNPQPWTLGDLFYKQLKLSSGGISIQTTNIQNVSEINLGVTGRLHLDSNGRRRKFSINLLEFDTQGNISKVGGWTTDGRLNITKEFDKVREDVSKEIQQINFTVAVKLDAPFVFKRNMTEDNEPIPDYSNDRFYGFNIDLMEKIAERLKIKAYHYVEVTEGITKQPDNSFTGIVGGLMTREYDIGLSPITVNVERSEVVDFTSVYFSLGLSILYKREADKEFDLFQFSKPFTVGLWGAIFAAFLITSLVLHLVGRVSPKQWDNPHPCSPDVDLIENDLTPSNSLWFTMGSFLQQGTEIMPKSGPTRIIAAFWWLFCLICVSSYTANLAAVLTKSKMKSKINSVDDLAKQTTTKYGCFANGSTRNFFRTSNMATFKRMNSFMVDTEEQYNTGSNAEGVEKVLEGSYAFIMESAPLKYELTKDCNLIEVGGDLNSLMYSIALPKYSPYTNPISDVILKLKEEQVILNLTNKWWQADNDTCAKVNKVESPIESSKLQLDNFVGVFLTLGALIAIGFVVLVIEMVVGAHRASKENKTTFRKEFVQNFLFSIKCCGNDEKPVRWPTKPKNEVNDEDIFGSIEHLDLSIGSLNTSTLPAWSDHQTSRSRTPPRSRPNSSSHNNRRRYDLMRTRSSSRSNSSLQLEENSLDLTKNTVVGQSSSEESLMRGMGRRQMKTSAF